jgi:hypothetical protein
MHFTTYEKQNGAFTVIPRYNPHSMKMLTINNAPDIELEVKESNQKEMNVDQTIC